MNKNEFLQELGACLAILEVKEQQDILAEYSQHIDMKIEKGLSEEEAIRDFGDIRELAAEILEAYHVNPDYKTAGNHRKKVDGKRVAQKGLRLWQLLMDVVKRAMDAVRRFCSAGAYKVKYGAKKGWSLIGMARKTGDGTAEDGTAGDGKTGDGKIEDGLAGNGNTEDGKTRDGNTEDRLTEDVRTGDGRRRWCRGDSVRSWGGGRRDGRDKTVPGRRSQIFAGIRTYPVRLCRFIAAVIVGTFHLCLYVALWCVRWGWNVCMILLALLSGIVTLCALFGFGMAVVWLAQGYPLAGISLIGLGVILCSGSFTYFCVSLIRIKKREERKTEDRKTENRKSGGEQRVMIQEKQAQEEQVQDAPVQEEQVWEEQVQDARVQEEQIQTERSEEVLHA